jgi:glycosyltransferase involved in cell wall biosynthesis
MSYTMVRVDAKIRIRVVAPIKDEEFFLPIFLAHYGSFCDSIILWDNGSTDRTLEIARAHPKVEVRHFVSDGFDTVSILRVLEESRRESIGSFDWCLFPDCDEMIISNPPGNERDVISAHTADILAPVGYCLVQKQGEPPLDPARDILKQRRHGYRSVQHSKPIVARPGAYFVWQAGRHGIGLGAGCQLKQVADLALLHLDETDFNVWLKRKMRRISPEDRRSGWGVKRWDRQRSEYDILWKGIQARAVSLDAEIPRFGIRTE